MVTLPPIPPRMQLLPRDERGYPVPWFVVWIDGKPEFRVADGDKRARAISNKLCWVCGQKLGDYLAFVLGPMCIINRTTSEPPAHRECAEFSAQACPFLTKPAATRRASNLPDGTCDPGGVSIRRNPGACAIWICKRYTLFRPSFGDEGLLIHVGHPHEIVWYAEGRIATRAEVLHSINTGMPILEKVAKQDGPEGMASLQEHYRRALALLPTT